MLYSVARNLLFRLDPEIAHELTIRQLKYTAHTPLVHLYQQQLPARPVRVMGLDFRNPVGLAAGLDKNGECIDAFAAMGFGHIEVGTVTPRPQPGNDKPRLFRIKPAQGIINRMGFNNHGVDAVMQNVRACRFEGVIGINIGKNLTTPVEEGREDYLICMDKVYQDASYIAVNISSPNTPGLRALQYGDALEDLLGSLKDRQRKLHGIHKKYTPLVLKIAPDVNEPEIIQIADALVRFDMDGVIATNTTLDRSLVKGLEHATEVGGLSGRPLQQRATDVIRMLSRELNGRVPIIGVGGIDSVVAAREKYAAGAELVQIYSGFIYHGLNLVRDIVKYGKVD